MHDVIIDAPNQTISIKNKRLGRPRKKRNWGVYLFDWLVKGLMLSLLISINFVLYSTSGNYKLFPSEYMLAPEILYILAGIFSVVIGVLFLFSFSSFFQNLISSFVVAGFVLAMLNQFALFDKTSILSVWVEQYLGAGPAQYFVGISHIVLAVAAGVCFFIFLVMASNQNIAYFTGVLLIIFVGILADAYLLRDKQEAYKVVYDNKLQGEQENGKKFIYIFLPNAAAYNYLEDMKETNTNSDTIQKTMDIMLAFYAKNNFMFYPNAYVKELDPFMNMVKSFNNVNKQDAEAFTLKNVIMDGYWRFDNISDEYVYLKDNHLFDTFRKAKYRISAYQSRGIDMCRKNNDIAVDKCVEKLNTPINFDVLNVSETEKIIVLFSQWINSTGLFPNKSTLYTLLKAVTNSDELPLVGIPYDGLYVVDSLNSLDMAAEDIAKDKGNRAYFVFVDLPADMFVYNEFCKVKNPSKWLAMESLPWIVNKNLYNKRNAYMEQTECLYGKLEEFLGKLNKNGLLDDSVIVIQGVSGADDLRNVLDTRNFIADFKNKRLVTMAIRDPLKKKFSLNYDVCSAPDIVKQYLYKKGKCQELASMEMHDGAKDEIKETLKKLTISEENIHKAMVVFDSWYKDWEKASKIKVAPNLLKSRLMPPGFVPKMQLPENEDGVANDNAEPVSEENAVEGENVSEKEQVTDIGEEVNLGEAKVLENPVEIVPEDEVQDFGTMMANEPIEEETNPAPANDNSEKTPAAAEK